ncbi:hypothetical protein P152DRAFT_374273, partial [Eremomyces bilateralis CBS 781.70]
MAWDHLSINRPHLVYIILGGFTSLFMLCSSLIKERLYIGEATVATICGIIFGPHAANLIDPMTWGNTDQITLEFSRIVLVVQCFAIGVELPRSYMEKHWRSVTLLLVPVMTFGWLITSLFIWWMFHEQMNWLDSLIVAACVTATDPVLASSVVGKGKFAKRIPKHLRDLLSAESGCNDGMAFPFIYIGLYIIRYRPDANKVAFHWFCFTVLYECVFGAIYGVLIGYIARRAIRYAHERDFIDRESFLVFYFVLALFCAGSGSILGVDDLLVGFAAGVGFSNDGWFLEKTEESHVSNVIDLLINLAFFVYFGTIIPWEQFNTDILGIHPWQLIVLGLLVLFFRRIPIMLALKPVIPDLKTWREALFAGHFGPIGVGAIFICILARAELETEGTTPLAELPPKDFEHMNVIEMIWPITAFLVITSIIVHGSSIAVFTLGKRINTLTLTLSYTQDPAEGPGWMERLPRIQSRSKSQASTRRAESVDSALEEKVELTPGGLAVPKNFLRRQKEEDAPSRSSSARPFRRRKRDSSGYGLGGPISQSAIEPLSMRQSESDITGVVSPTESGRQISATSPEDDSLVTETDGAPLKITLSSLPPQVSEIYHEGDHFVFEDRGGNVLAVTQTRGENDDERIKNAQEDLLSQFESRGDEESRGRPRTPKSRRASAIPEAKKEEVSDQIEPVSAPDHHLWNWHEIRRRVGQIRHHDGGELEDPAKGKGQKRGPALAYQFGNTIIVEDEHGEVIKKFDIPVQKKSDRPVLERRATIMDASSAWTKDAVHKMGGMFGAQRLGEAGPSTAGPSGPAKKPHDADADDDRLRFRVAAGGRKMSTAEFIESFRQLEPKARMLAVNNSDAPEHVKQEIKADAMAQQVQKARGAPAVNIEETSSGSVSPSRRAQDPARPSSTRSNSPRNAPPRSSEYTRLEPIQSRSSHTDDEGSHEVPTHPLAADLARFNFGNHGGQETPANRRRRLVARVVHTPSDQAEQAPDDNEGETTAERKRREGALGITGGDENSESSDDEE